MDSEKSDSNVRGAVKRYRVIGTTQKRSSYGRP